MAGAGGEHYWTVSKGVAARTGWSCRECKSNIAKGEPICVRDGRKMRFFYHERCFSGFADPRTQPASTFSSAACGGATSGPSKYGAISESAPAAKGRGKWSTSYYGYGGPARQ